MPKTIYTSAQDVEAAFYEALERADLDALMAVWAEDEDIVCVHPGGPRHTGYAAIREAWRRVFDRGPRLQVSTANPSVVQTPFTAVHSLLEQISIADDSTTRAPVIATNVYLRGPLGWRMVVHHASPAPASGGETPKTLH